MFQKITKSIVDNFAKIYICFVSILVAISFILSIVSISKSTDTANSVVQLQREFITLSQDINQSLKSIKLSLSTYEQSINLLFDRFYAENEFWYITGDNARIKQMNKDYKDSKKSIQNNIKNK